MNPLLKLKTTPALLITLALLCFGLLPRAQAVVPPPDGGYPGFNTAEGQNALFSLTTGSANTAVGWFSLKSNVDTSFNTGVGAGTLLLNTADANTAVGAAALLFNTIGAQNTAIGTAALLNNTEGVENTAVGSQALALSTEGDDNTAVGFQALNSNTTGDFNTATGGFALFSNTEGGFNTANGNDALLSNTTGSGNTAVGFSALNSNTQGINNTATGLAALGNNTGSHNTANGVSALALNSSGSNNTALGELAGLGVTTANNVICIGFNVAGANVDNSCFIGNIYSNVQPIVGTDPDSVTITSSGRLGRGNVSSRRYKHDIQPMEKASEALYALKPASFRYNKEYDATQTLAFGLIAEQVAEVYPDLVGRNPEGQPESVRYDAVNAMLLNEFLKEHKTVQEQGATIAELKKEIAALTAGLQKVSAQLAAASPSDGGLEASKPAPRVVNNP
jgi:trimeric autotransporter adhesin